jgi:DNA-directed RNA polymerase sigma subunit (sigma70/sigma32)
MKRFYNGHKTFTAAEATAIYELQTHEKVRRDKFEQVKNELIAFRNPLTGEATPRPGGEEKLMSMLSILDDRERAIVEDYFGLLGTSRTLEDIGNDFNLTKERVRQIKEKALRKLRNECSVLFDYM